MEDSALFISPVDSRIFPPPPPPPLRYRTAPATASARRTKWNWKSCFVSTINISSNSSPNGNLQQRLHSSNTLLAWRRRVAIAFQLAQAICYLHDGCSPHIVHGDVKSSNVLLDENLDCKLCDFGSAKVGFSSAIDPPPPAADSNARRPWRSNRTAVVGSPGYTDPAYLRTGLASKKNDVYGFGVVVLELITGVEAFSAARGERLTARAEPMLRDAAKVAEMVDPRLAGGEIDLGEARAMAALSARCLSDAPGVRPSASEILTVMRNTIYHL